MHLYISCHCLKGKVHLSKSLHEMRYEDENIWLTQRMLATLYDVEIPTINYHIKKVFDDMELVPQATIRKFLIVQSEGNRQVSRDVEHYNLQMIISSFVDHRLLLQRMSGIRLHLNEW